MNRAVMLRRCPRSWPVGAMMLQNWQLEFYTHATIVPVTGTQCAGVLWNLTPECEEELDEEGIDKTTAEKEHFEENEEDAWE